MSNRIPIVSFEHAHDQLPAGDTIAGSTIQRSSNVGNVLTVGSDGGLMVPATAAGALSAVAYGSANTSYNKSNWQDDGTPSNKLVTVKVNLSTPVPADSLLLCSVAVTEAVIGKDSPRPNFIDVSLPQLQDAVGATLSRLPLRAEMYARILLPPMSQYTDGSTMPYTFGGMAPRFLYNAQRDVAGAGKQLASLSVPLNLAGLALTPTGDAPNTGTYTFSVYVTLLALP